MKLLNNKGFTLLELLVVIAIIGVLASIVVLSMEESRNRSREGAALAEMDEIRSAMELLKLDSDLYPHKRESYCPPMIRSNNEVNLSLNTGGLTATDGTYLAWSGPYISDVLDPWGNSYFLDEDYYCTAGAFGCDGFSATNDTQIWSVLVSCGPDGMIGNDPSNPQPNNGIGCAYNDDNVVYALCKL